MKEPFYFSARTGDLSINSLISWILTGVLNSELERKVLMSAVTLTDSREETESLKVDSLSVFLSFSDVRGLPNDTRLVIKLNLTTDDLCHALLF